MRWIETNGTALRYEVDGDAGETVVLVHEAGGSLESWDAVASMMKPRYRTLRYDQRGFGMSERSATLSLEGMVEDLRSLLDAVDIEGPVHLAGTAIGGSIVLAFAAHHPTRVASVIATSPVTGNLSETAVNSMELRAQKVEREGMRAAADASLEKSYPAKLRGDAVRFSQYRGRFLANDPYSFAALSRAYGKINLPALYAQVKCPALVIGCTDDSIKPPAECAAAAGAMPHGQYVEAASGHFIAVQAPEQFISIVTPFLESVNAGTNFS